MNNNLEPEIITKFIAGECTPEEYEEVRTWAEENPRNKQFLKNLQQTWNISGELNLDQNEDRAWKNLSDRLFQAVRSAPIHTLNHRAGRSEKSSLTTDLNIGKSASVSLWILRVAAVLLVAAGISYAIYSYSSTRQLSQPLTEASAQRVMREVAAERGQRVRVTFSDGTSVTLNASSVIRFPEQFDNGIREVELKGEAYFSVVHKGAIPFIVHTDKADVRVLGTKFNVSAYPKDPKVEVVVVRGKVAVRSDRSAPDKMKLNKNFSQGDEVILTEGQYTEVLKGGVPKIPETVSLEPYMGWVEGRLVFESTPLQRVLKKLEHYYDQRFVVSDTTLYDRRLTATFERESFSKVLDVMTLSMDMKYKRKFKNNAILLSPEDKKH